MAQLTCTSLVLGYDGKEILENISFSRKQRGLSLHRRGERLRKKHLDENPSRPASSN